jgi:hypothetical protein
MGNYSLCLHDRADHAGSQVSLLVWRNEVCRHGVNRGVLRLSMAMKELSD